MDASPVSKDPKGRIPRALPVGSYSTVLGYLGPSAQDRRFEEAVGELTGRLQETGILPLKIRLPKSGTVYRFNRLMTTQDVLTLDTTFVHLPLPWMPFAALGLVVVPIGGLTVVRFHRR